MAGATTTIIKSVTLQAGESFVLPPGATLIGTDNASNFTSTCELPELETLSCFGVVLAAFENDNADTEYFEQGTQYIKGFELSGVYYGFTADVVNTGANGTFDMTELYNKMKALLPAIIDGNTGYAGDATNGQRNYLVISTIPSVGNNLVLRIVTSSPAGSGYQTVTYKSAFYPYADLSALGYESFPECPIVEPT